MYFVLRISDLTPVPLLHSIADMHHFSAEMRSSGKRIALVPTMGALHEGHLSLIRAAVEQSDQAITSVFVNPTQFGPNDDYDRYPRNLERDCTLAFGAGAGIVFAPTVEEMYPGGPVATVDVGPLGRKLEGKSRPGHFNGVATVVSKLFRITMPHVALFGQKDAQQVTVVRAMVKSLGLGVEIVPMPIVREADGLAQSSRNLFLTKAERAEAPVLYHALTHAAKQLSNGGADPDHIRQEMSAMIGRTSGVIDYISIADVETLDEVTVKQSGQELLISLAVRYGSTRLIDNCLVRIP